MVKNKIKLRKKIYNILFWGYGLCAGVILIWGLFCIWSKVDLFSASKYITSQILEVTNFFLYFSIVLSVIGFLFNMFIFNGEITKIIDKEHYSRVAIMQSVIFIIGIVLLMFTPMFLKLANLTFYDYKLKALYCLGYCTCSMITFFLFYFFSFINVIVEDESYNRARPYVYRIAEFEYNVVYKLINKKIDKSSFKGEFFNSNYKIEYCICHRESECVYAFINLKNINDEFFKLYSNERLIDFVEYLYNNVLDKNKNVKIAYFICVDEYNDNFKDLIQLSIYQDEHFTVIHSLIDLNARDLYIGGIRDDKKSNVKDYIALKEEIDNLLVDVIEKKR